MASDRCTVPALTPLRTSANRCFGMVLAISLAVALHSLVFPGLSPLLLGPKLEMFPRNKSVLRTAPGTRCVLHASLQLCVFSSTPGRESSPLSMQPALFVCLSEALLSPQFPHLLQLGSEAFLLCPLTSCFLAAPETLPGIESVCHLLSLSAFRMVPFPRHTSSASRQPPLS